MNKYNFIESQEYGINYKSFKAGGGRILSPSGLSKSLTNPCEWYLDFTGGNPNPFMGNEATVRGSMIHAAIEAHYLGEEIDYDEVRDWLKLKSAYIPDLIGLEDNIISSTKQAIDVFKREMDHSTFTSTSALHLEKYMEVDILPNLKLAGTADAIFSNTDGIDSCTMVDWKTSKMMKSSIGDYKAQLYAYVILARRNEINITRIATAYIVHPSIPKPHATTGKMPKPSPTHVYRVKYVEEVVDANMLREMELYLDNYVKAIQLVDENPHLADVVFRTNCFYGGYLASAPRDFANPGAFGSVIQNIDNE